MRILILILALWVLAAGQAHATQCNITANPINFGFYDPLSSIPTDSTGTISVTCQTPSHFPQMVTVQVTAGGSGSFGQRAMTNSAGGTLLYNLFTDSSLSTVFGDGSGGSAALTNTVHRAAPWSVTIYGRMPPLQQVPAGAYGDVLTVTILW